MDECDLGPASQTPTLAGHQWARAQGCVGSASIHTGRLHVTNVKSTQAGGRGTVAVNNI